MEATLHGLADLLLKAVPTIIFFAFLTKYLKRVFFEPLARILDERKRATEGVRQLAQQAFAAADEKASEFQRALQLARAEIEQEHEALRRRWDDEQVETIQRARAEADQQILEAKQQIADEVERAQADLNAAVESLSDHIVSSVLRPRRAA
ncbi:MAG: ATP synthase F0 subunit B [Bryobacteraceae bacterium]